MYGIQLAREKGRDRAAVKGTLKSDNNNTVPYYFTEAALYDTVNTPFLPIHRCVLTSPKTTTIFTLGSS